jgi:hypothetical protein
MLWCLAHRIALILQLPYNPQVILDYMAGATPPPTYLVVVMLIACTKGFFGDPGYPRVSSDL